MPAKRKPKPEKERRVVQVYEDELLTLYTLLSEAGNPKVYYQLNKEREMLEAAYLSVRWRVASAKSIVGFMLRPEVTDSIEATGELKRGIETSCPHWGRDLEEENEE